MADYDLVLKGTLVLPDRLVPEGHVAVRDGLVAALGQGEPPGGREHHDLGDALILPGAIDAQVHSLSQKNQEDFIWSTRTAAAGGVTTIVDMPYDEGNLVCSAEAVRGKAAHGESQARVDFALYGTIDPEEGVKRIREQVDAGGVRVHLMRQRMAQLHIESEILRLIRLRTVSAAVRGEEPGPEASVRKVLADEHGQHLMAAAKDLAGSAALLTDSGPMGADPGVWHFGWLFSQALTIGGGTGDVQRNILGERVLGLPSEPDVEAGLTWAESRHGSAAREGRTPGSGTGVPHG